MEKMLETLMNLGVTYGVRIVGVLLFIVVAWIIAAWAQGVVTRRLEQRNFDKALTRFFSSSIKWVILGAALIASLGVFGVETTSFAAVLGAAGLALGLAFQGTLSNFSAGIMLLVFRPFNVDDWVNISGVVGKVYEIGLFTVSMDTPDNRRIILPNSGVFGSTIENITFHPQRRVDINVGVEYSADLNKARAALEQAAATVTGGLAEPAPQVFLKELGGSSVDFVVRVWVNTPDYWNVWQALTQSVKEHLDEAGIGIPYPQMDVHLDGGLDK
jgi:small conductance mechanosensitive channel